VGGPAGRRKHGVGRSSRHSAGRQHRGAGGGRLLLRDRLPRELGDGSHQKGLIKDRPVVAHAFEVLPPAQVLDRAGPEEVCHVTFDLAREPVGQALDAPASLLSLRGLALNTRGRPVGEVKRAPGGGGVDGTPILTPRRPMCRNRTVAESE
jgi:hypothetical protein